MKPEFDVVGVEDDALGIIGLLEVAVLRELDRDAPRICSFVLRVWLSAGTPGNKTSSVPTARCA